MTYLAGDLLLKHKKWLKYLTIGTVFPLILLFQNCSQFDPVELADFESINSPGAGDNNQDNPNNPTTPPPVIPPVTPPPPDTSVARGLQVYSQNCAECHGLIDGSSVLNRSGSQITTAINVIPVMSRLRGAISSSDLEALVNALNRQPDVVTNPVNGRTTFSCEPNSVAHTPLLKLTNREYRNSVVSLLQDVSSSLASDSQLTTLFNAVPSDVIIENRDTLKEQNRLITEQGFSTLFEAAWRAGGLVAASSGLNNYPNTNGCLAAATINQTCFTSFVRELSSRAFRRPVNNTEAA